MYTDFFAELLRFVPAVAPRRGVTLGLARGLLGVVSLALGSEEAFGKGSAKTKNKKRKRKKQRQRRGAGCTPNCAGKTCGDDGCGGSCGACAVNQTCQGGTCVCACPPDQVCLGNGSCATVCFGEGCTGSCDCGELSAEGPQHCIPDDVEECADVPQVCASTTDCPLGQYCQQANCGPGGNIERRCVPLCNP
jgi:hypothetical protein